MQKNKIVLIILYQQKWYIHIFNCKQTLNPVKVRVVYHHHHPIWQLISFAAWIIKTPDTTLTDLSTHNAQKYIGIKCQRSVKKGKLMLSSYFWIKLKNRKKNYLKSWRSILLIFQHVTRCPILVQYIYYTVTAGHKRLYNN